MLRGGKGRHPYHVRKHLIAALHLWAYGDESGIDERAKYCLILGYIAAPLQWQRFNELWKRSLENYEVPEFHSIDFFPRDRQRSSTNPYRGWSEERRIEFLDTLLGIRAHCRLVPIGWAVDVNAFRALTYEQRRFFTGGYLWTQMSGEKVEGTTNQFNMALRRKFTTSGAPSQPYLAAFDLFLKDVHDMATDDALIHVVFDQQNVLQSGATDHFNRSWAGGGYAGGMQFVSIGYQTSHSEPALQLADLYSYPWGRYLHGSMTDELRHAMRKLTRLKKHLNIADEDHFHREWRKLQDDLAGENRIAGITDERLDVHVREDDES